MCVGSKACDKSSFYLISSRIRETTSLTNTTIAVARVNLSMSIGHTGLSPARVDFTYHGGDQFRYGNYTFDLSTRKEIELSLMCNLELDRAIEYLTMNHMTELQGWIVIGLLVAILLSGRIYDFTWARVLLMQIVAELRSMNGHKDSEYDEDEEELENLLTS